MNFEEQIIAAAASEPVANERGSSLIGKGYMGPAIAFLTKRKEYVVGGKIKGIRSCGYALMEDSGCAVKFNVIVLMQFE